MEQQENFSYKGTIALDIDGTITTSPKFLPKRVKNFLETLPKKNWELLFLTGRTFSFAYPVLSELECPFHMAVQNGTIFLKMPQKKVLFKKYLERSSLLEGIQGALIESGFENQDICYYKSSDFNKEELEYLEFRKKISGCQWIDLETFDQLPVLSYPVIKYFSDEKRAKKIREEISHLNVQHITTKDPFRPPFFLTLISQKEGTKENVLTSCKRPLIVAGDDYNDLGMVKTGDIKIAMTGAPQELLNIADIVAKPANVEGIIEALEEALRRV